MTFFLISIIVLALVFDYINGFHDAANSIATVVSTRVLTPFQAVLWAAAFNFAAFFIFKDHGVANTIAKTVQEQYVTLPVIASGLLAAIAWNLLTWWLGIPSSSSHTLIGGFMGAAVAHAGFSSLNAEPIIKTASFIFLAPVVGMLMAFLISLWFLHSFVKAWYPKLISIAVMVGVFALVGSQIETKKDFLGGSSYTIQLEEKVSKEKLKKAFTFKDDTGKEYSPVLSSGKDKAGQKDTTGTVYILKTSFMKDKAATTVNEELTGKVLKAVEKAGTTGSVVEAHRVTKDSPDKERFDDSHLKAGFESYYLRVIFHGKNFKWFLFAIIITIVGVFTLFLSGMAVGPAERWFKRMQLVSSAAFSIGHGGNDAQKVMGIITAALIAGGQIKEFHEMPNWVPLACYAAIGIGTMSGGWKIIKTMGSKITKVTPFEGVAAETAGAATLFLTENLKIPVSTTHTITGAIIGVGATKRLSAVRWGVTYSLVIAWILTIPVSAVLAGGVYYIFYLFGA